MQKDTSSKMWDQGSEQQSEVASDLRYRFTQPLLKQLYEKLDRRLVQTFLDLMIVIIVHRHRNMACS